MITGYGKYLYVFYSWCERPIALLRLITACRLWITSGVHRLFIYHIVVNCERLSPNNSGAVGSVLNYEESYEELEYKNEPETTPVEWPHIHLIP